MAAALRRLDAYVISRPFQIGPKIKEKMMTSGSMMIGYCPLESRGYVNFFRIIVNGVQLDEKDVDYVIETIDVMGKDL